MSNSEEDIIRRLEQDNHGRLWEDEDFGPDSSSLYR